MLRRIIADEIEKQEEVAERLVESFRVTEKEWLEFRARQTTILRLMRELGADEPVYALAERESIA